MDEYIDYTDCPTSNLFYGGSERKAGVVIDGVEYMLKYQKHTAFGKRFNHVCEYLGSRLFASMGFNTQEVHLGTYRGEPVVACRNFVEEGCQFVPFNDVGESTLERDKSLYQYDFTDVMQMLHANSKLTDIEGTVRWFWDLFIGDALLGNFDRHGGNWGFLKRRGVYELAPVFDNGSCLFPNMTDEEEMLRVIGSPQETRRRVESFPTSQIRLDGKKSSYAQVIASLAFEECNEALARVVPRINLTEMFDRIDATPTTTEVQRSFYKHMVEARYRSILLDPFCRLTGVAQ